VAKESRPAKEREKERQTARGKGEGRESNGPPESEKGQPTRKIHTKCYNLRLYYCIQPLRFLCVLGGRGNHKTYKYFSCETKCKVSTERHAGTTIE
jgi:hypothetical protein